MLKPTTFNTNNMFTPPSSILNGKPEFELGCWGGNSDGQAYVQDDYK